MLKEETLWTEIIDTYPSFIEFWNRVRDLAIDTQIEAWHSEYMTQWPELLKKQIKEYKRVLQTAG